MPRVEGLLVAGGFKLKYISAGTKVRMKAPSDVPPWSQWDDDHQRTSTVVKKRLQKMFFLADKKIQAEVVYVGSESERDKLRNLGRLKVAVRDPAGSAVTFTAAVAELLAS